MLVDEVFYWRELKATIVAGGTVDVKMVTINVQADTSKSIIFTERVRPILKNDEL